MNHLEILEHLDMVKPTGPDQWQARCPAHDDRGPSLAIKDGGDRTLLHCFAGCTAQDIVEAVGLQLRNLFAERLPAGARRQMARTVSRQKLEAALQREITVLGIVLANRSTDRQHAHDRAFQHARPEFKPMPSGPWERELLAAQRICKLIDRLYPVEVRNAAA
jgi:DNA primase